MGHRKAFSISTALFLALTLFVSLVLAEACFCGQACLHGPRFGTGASANSMYHVRCPGALCESCNLEETQTLEAANFYSPAGHAKPFASPVTLLVFDEHPPADSALEDFESVRACRTAPPYPIYLTNRSLLR